MNLIEGALGYLDAGVIQKASALVGESPASTRRGLDAAVPAIVAALATEAAEPTGAQAISSALEETGLRGTQESVSERLYAASGDELMALGRDLLGRVFHGRIRGVVDATAASTGVKPPAMASLFTLAAPLCFGVLGTALHARHLDATGLAGLLGAQRSVATSTLPPSVVAALGAMEGPRSVAPVASVRRARTDRFWPLVLAIPLAIVGGMLLRQRTVPRTEPWVPARGLGVGVVPRPSPPTLEPAPAAVGPTVEAPAPAAIPGESVVDEVTAYLEDDAAPPSKRFVFEDLNFELATTNLTPPSIGTIERLAAALEAHPEARILVEGHTDQTGTPEHNAHLSMARANAVKDALVVRGIAADRIETAGAGQDRPVASNDTEAGRARNRRTEIVVNRR